MPIRVVVLTLSLALAACSPAEPNDPPKPTPDAGSTETPDAGHVDDVPTGTLLLTATGLPEGIVARVVVDGPQFNETVSTPATLDRLTAGTYTVSPLVIEDTAGAGSWLARDGVVTVTLVEGSAGVRVALAYTFLEAQLQPAAKPMTAAETDHLSDATIGDAGATLTFDAAEGAIGTLKVGDVVGLGVTDKTPAGYLGKVTAVREVNGKIEVEATRADLGDAVKQGAFTIEREYTPDDVVGTEALVDGITFSKEQRLTKDGREANGLLCLSLDQLPIVQQGTAEGDLKISGKACFSPSIVFAPWIEDGDLRLIAQLGYIAESSFSMKGSGEWEAFVRQALPLAKIKLPRIQFNIYNFPIIIDPVITFNIQVGGSVNGSFDLSYFYRSSAVAGACLKNKEWTGIASHDWTAERRESKVETTGWTIRAGVGPELTLFFYGYLGPVFAIDVYLKYETYFEENPWWKLFLGVDGYLGIKANLFNLLTPGYSFKVLDVATEIMHAPPGPPGPIIVRVTPKTATAHVCAEVPFTATAQRDPTLDLGWTAPGAQVLSDKGTATFVAPSTPGDYVLTVESNLQPGQKDTANITVNGSAGSLTVLVSGLPEGAAHGLVLRDAAGHDTPIRNTNLPCLETGTYTLVANAVTADGKLWVPHIDQGTAGRHAEETFTLAQGESATHHVIFENRRSNLGVQVLGQAADLGWATVRVTGPFGFNRPLTSTDTTFNALELGTYTITASPVTFDGSINAPVPATQTVELDVGTSATATIRYASTAVGGLYLLGNDRVVQFSDPSALSTARLSHLGQVLNDIRFDQAGNLWTSGLFITPEGQFKHRITQVRRAELRADPEPALELVPKSGAPFALNFDADGNLWVGLNGYQAGVTVLLERYSAASLTQPNPQPTHTIVPPDQRVDLIPRSIEFDAQGNLWFNTQKTLYRYDAATLLDANVQPTLNLLGGPNMLEFVIRGTDAWLATTAPAGVWKVPLSAIGTATTGAILDAATVSISGFCGNPGGLAFSPGGDLYAAYSGCGATNFANGAYRIAAADQGQNQTVDPNRTPSVYDYSTLLNATKARWLP